MLAHPTADWLLVAQGMMPRFDAAYCLALTSRVLHILSAIVLVGGVFYLRMVVAPRLRQSDADAGSDPWFAGRRGAWAMWVGIATLVLIITGLWNYWQVIREYEKMAASYHMLAGIKMLLALLVFFLAAVLAGKSAVAEQLRQKMKFWLGLCLVVAIAVVILGSVLRSYPHTKLLEGPSLLAPAND
jgi:hypothetical protein